MTKPLKLIARNLEDIPVLSACLQDAVLKVDDVAYAPNQRRLALVANRYRWEGGRRERVRCGFHLEDVTRVSLRAFPAHAPGAVMELLAIEAAAGEDGLSAVITFTFAGGAAIRAEVECVEAALEDISEPWKAMATPAHDD